MQVWLHQTTNSPRIIYIQHGSQHIFSNNSHQEWPVTHLQPNGLTKLYSVYTCTKPDTRLVSCYNIENNTQYSRLHTAVQHTCIATKLNMDTYTITSSLLSTLENLLNILGLSFSNIWQILVMPPHEFLSIIQLANIAIHMMANN